MVDPPVFASDILKNLGVHSKLITAIIITHCHADHDAGAFHKILFDQRVEVFKCFIKYRLSQLGLS